MTTAAIAPGVKVGVCFGFRQTDHPGSQPREMENEGAGSISEPGGSEARRAHHRGTGGGQLRFARARCLQQAALISPSITASGGPC